MHNFLMDNGVYLAIGCGLAAIVYGIVLIMWVLKLPAGNEKMQEIAGAIQEGAKAYLNRQTQYVAIVAVVLFALLCVAIDWQTGLAFLIGAVLSAATGWIGMMVSVRANVRTAEAARKRTQARHERRLPRRFDHRPAGRRPGASGSGWFLR